jgi:hypothetical protein
VSKWSQKTKRGGARAFGLVTEPQPDDWIVSAGGSGQLILHRYADLPTPATHWGARYRISGQSTWLYWSNQTSDTFTISGLTPSASYEIQIAWWQPPPRISEYSSSKTQTAGA